MVRQTRIERDLEVLKGFTQTMLDRNVMPSIKVLKKRIRPAGAKYAMMFGIHPADEIFYSSLYFTGSLCWQNRGLGRFFRSRRGSKKDMRKLNLDVAARKTAVLAA